MSNYLLSSNRRNSGWYNFLCDFITFSFQSSIGQGILRMQLVSLLAFPFPHAFAKSWWSKQMISRFLPSLNCSYISFWNPAFESHPLYHKISRCIFYEISKRILCMRSPRFYFFDSCTFTKSLAIALSLVPRLVQMISQRFYSCAARFFYGNLFCQRFHIH